MGRVSLLRRPNGTFLLDLELMKETVKYTKRMIESEPWKSLVVSEVDPGKEYSTDEEIKGQFIGILSVLLFNAFGVEYLHDYSHTCWHAIGSNSMLPRDKNGVVDPNLKVCPYDSTSLAVAYGQVGVWHEERPRCRSLHPSLTHCFPYSVHRLLRGGEG